MKEDIINQLGDYDVPFCEQQWAIPENIHTPPPPPYGRHLIGYLKFSGFPGRTTAVFAGFQSLLIQNIKEFQNFAKI